jgi:hypothetical protein
MQWKHSASKRAGVAPLHSSNHGPATARAVPTCIPLPRQLYSEYESLESFLLGSCKHGSAVLMKITSSARSTSRCLGSQGREDLVSIWKWKILNSPNSLVREVVVIGTGVFAFVMPSLKAFSLPVMMCRRPISLSSGQVFHVRNSPYLPSRSLGLGRRWLRSAMHVNICYCSLQLNTSCALSITIGQRPYKLNEPVVQGMRRRTNWVQPTVTLLDTASLTE